MSQIRGYYLEDLEVGMEAHYSRTISDTDVVLFAGISGDDNPVHLNEEYARTTPFEGRIVHGMLLAGLISCVAGTRMPGPGAIYVDQKLRFRAPVRIGDTVTAVNKVAEVLPERRRIRMQTLCRVGETVVVDGEATFLVPSRAALAEAV